MISLMHLNHLSSNERTDRHLILQHYKKNKKFTGKKPISPKDGSDLSKHNLHNKEKKDHSFCSPLLQLTRNQLQAFESTLFQSIFNVSSITFTRYLDRKSHSQSRLSRKGKKIKYLFYPYKSHHNNRISQNQLQISRLTGKITRFT